MQSDHSEGHSQRGGRNSPASVSLCSSMTSSRFLLNQFPYRETRLAGLCWNVHSTFHTAKRRIIEHLWLRTRYHCAACSDTCLGQTIPGKEKHTPHSVGHAAPPISSTWRPCAPPPGRENPWEEWFPGRPHQPKSLRSTPPGNLGLRALS